MPFSSSKYFYSCLRLSNLVDLSFEYLSFSNKRKTIILFPSPLTFLQWPIPCLRFDRFRCWLFPRRRQIALTNVVDFGAKLASAQKGMRSEHVTKSNGGVVQMSSILKLPTMLTPVLMLITFIIKPT